MTGPERPIAGSGPVGSSAAALLSSSGIDTLLVTKRRWLADTPRARVPQRRTMEVLRDPGLRQFVQQATLNHLSGNNAIPQVSVGCNAGPQGLLTDIGRRRLAGGHERGGRQRSSNPLRQHRA